MNHDVDDAAGARGAGIAERRAGAPEKKRAEDPFFRTLYVTHFGRVVGAVRMFGVPARNGEDIAQDVFVAAFCGLGRYDTSRPIKPWLMTITYRKAADYLRSARHRRELLSPMDDDLPDPGADAERRSSAGEAQRLVATLLQALDEEERTVFMMHLLDEVPLVEIARALGISEGTADSRFRRGRMAFHAAARRRAAVERRTGGAAPLLMLPPAALLDAARELAPVSEGAQARIWDRIVRAPGVGGTAGGAAGALAAVTQASALRMLSGAALALLVAAGGGAAITWRALAPSALPAAIGAEAPQDARAPQDTAVAPEATAALPPLPRPGEAETAALGTEVPRDADPPSAVRAPDTGAAGRATKGGAHPAAGAMPAAGELSAEQAERALIDRAKRSLAARHPEAAVKDLDRHARLFPHGWLAGPREELRGKALAQMASPGGGTR